MDLIGRIQKKGLALRNAIALRRWRHRRYVSDASPIIVGGCPRSGTTLMRVILDTHPNICCGPEARIFGPRWPRQSFLASRFGIPETTIRELARRTRSQAAFTDEFFGLYCELQKKPRWAEKTPQNVQQLDFIFGHFPKARFVHVIRDGRDTVCSLRTHPRHKVVNGELVPLNTRHPIEQCIERWVGDVRLGLRHRRDPRYMEVKYEDLVSQPQKTFKRVFRFIGERFDERILEFHTVGGRSRDYTNFPQNPEATKAIYTAAVSRWQSDLTPSEVAQFKRMAGRLLIDLQYVADHSW